MFLKYEIFFNKPKSKGETEDQKEGRCRASILENDLSSSADLNCLMQVHGNNLLHARLDHLRRKEILLPFLLYGNLPIIFLQIKTEKAKRKINPIVKATA